MFNSTNRLKKKVDQENKKNTMTIEEIYDEINKQNIKNIILVICLIVAFSSIFFASNKLKKEIITYNNSDLSKSVYSITKDIKPLYPDKKENKKEKENLEINNVEDYDQIVDKFYGNVNYYYNEYKNVYKEYNITDIEYIKLNYISSNGILYYYVTNEEIYVSKDDLEFNEDTISKMKKSEISSNLILNIVKKDIPYDFVNYLDYLINQEYFSNQHNTIFNLTGTVNLLDGSRKKLSLNSFESLSSVLDNVNRVIIWEN